MENRRDSPSYFLSLMLLSAAFMTVSLPSVKLVYSSEILNALPVLMFSLFFVFYTKISLSKDAKIVILFWTMFSIILMINLFFKPGGWGEAFRNLYFVSLISLIALLPVHTLAPSLTYMLVLWGGGIAFWQILLGINYSAEMGQTYLTVGLPIGISLSILLVYSFITNRVYKRVGFLLAAILCLYALSSIKVRGILIFSVASALIFICGFVFIGKRAGILSKLVSLSTLVCVVLFIYFVVLPNIEFSQLYRLERLIKDPGSEPRVEIYIASIRLMLDNFLLGVGPAGIYREIGIYPHNIFIEIMLSVGLIGAVFICCIFVLWMFFLYIVIRDVNRYKDFVGIAVAGLAAFMQWNTSFDLQTSYIPISLMVILIKGVAKEYRSQKFY